MIFSENPEIRSEKSEKAVLNIRTQWLAYL